MTNEQIAKVVTAQGGNPDDPICIGCAQRPEELPLESFLEEGQSKTEYVLENEGTLNTKNGHFLCDDCYIKNGQPSSKYGWVAP